MNMVGSWAYDVLEIVRERPDDLRDVSEEVLFDERIRDTA
jgi:hypothetical protein